MACNGQILLRKTSIIDVGLAYKSVLSRFSMLINYTMWYLINSAFFMVQIFQSQDFQVSRVLGFSRSRIFWVQVFEGPGPESGSEVYNHFHNILRLLDVLRNFVTSSCLTSCRTT